jgi:hypothetical protein
VTRADGIADAVATTRSGGDRYVVRLRDGTDDRFVPLMAQLGLVEQGEVASHARA